MPHLEKMFLEDYILYSILETDRFFALPELRGVSLSGNKLRYIHPNVFRNLQNLTLLVSRNAGFNVLTGRHFIN
jgi:Leucine-rich repeat (LRR) protein